jgi:hypothetical protein
VAFLNPTVWIRNRNMGLKAQLPREQGECTVTSKPKGMPRPPLGRPTHACGNMLEMQLQCSQACVAPGVHQLESPHSCLPSGWVSLVLGRRSICLCCSPTAREILLVGKSGEQNKAKRKKKKKEKAVFASLVNPVCQTSP